MVRAVSRALLTLMHVCTAGEVATALHRSLCRREARCTAWSAALRVLALSTPQECLFAGATEDWCTVLKFACRSSTTFGFSWPALVFRNISIAASYGCGILTNGTLICVGSD